MTPMRFAPAVIAQRASSGRTTPQTLTITEPGATGRTASSAAPIISKMAAPGSAARIRASPTSTPLQAILRHPSTSSAVERPLRAMSLVGWPGPKGILWSSRSHCATWFVRSFSSLKVCRSRLLTPSTRAPAATATRNSLSVTTSTRGSSPCSRQHPMSALSLLRGRIETIRRAVSAPWARASSTWYSSTRKSFRRHAGLRVPLSRACCWVFKRTSLRSSRVPLNHFGSVSTDRTPAPTFEYFSACSPASMSAAMSPLDGEARLNSAARASPQGEASAASSAPTRHSGGPCSATKASARALSSASGRRAFASATSLTRCSTISWSLVCFAEGSPKPYRCPRSSSSSITAQTSPPAATSSAHARGRPAAPAAPAL
mmetsp:Transcript_113362/g.307845  ORF Transcript_113362/g.307845 Transcript_113362/m.307845 type:complete len:374 (-) Transcript_113362:256-1377(-)